MQNIICYKGIGDVCYVRNKRARNLSIRINQRGEVRVTVPGRLSMRRAESFFLSRKTWVERKISEAGSVDCKKHIPAVGEELTVLGKKYLIKLKTGEADTEAAVWRILKVAADAYLPGRLTDLANKHSFSFTGLKIRKMKSRWGSCTARKSINLNSWLCMLPIHLIDYVLLHELTHTKYPNHGEGFWKELDRVCGGSSLALRKELRRHRIMCFPAGKEASQ